MPSIINGLFSGRSGIASHGIAIAVVGDNISNASTIGYKRSRSEFEDIVAGGQTSGKVVGSGSSISAVSNVFEQGTLEFTGRSLDLAIDGNGFFIVQKNGQQLYTRAGNFRVNDEGLVVTQKGDLVLGFPAGGSGALETININTIEQSNISTQNVSMAGNLDSSADVLAGGAGAIPAVTAAGSAGAQSTTTYSELSDAAEFSTVVNIFDDLGQAHTVTFYFYHTAMNTTSSTWVVRGYVNSEEVDVVPGTSGLPRQIGTQTLTFDSTGALTTATPTLVGSMPWQTGAASQSVDFTFSPFTQYATSSGIQSISGDGNGIGAVTSVSIDRNGSIFALLDNGQAAVIGTIGMANFSNPEGLVRIGGNYLQQSTDSGAPIIGNPNTGTFGAVEAGSIELSTVDIASEFVKLITLQRGFQANSRIITTINQLLNEIIQLV